MVRLNDEIFKLADFKLNKANNILIFDGAIIAVLVLFIIPDIFFSLSLFNAVKLVNFPEFRVIDSEKLLDKYWGHDKYEILTQLTSSLARFIKLNQGIGDEKNEISKKEIYNLYLNDSLKYIKWGVVWLLIVFLVIFLSFLFFQNVFRG